MLPRFPANESEPVKAESNPMSKNHESPPVSEMNEEEVEAEIDETLDETFPASDPPSWTLGTDHPVKSQTDAEDTKE
jgi:hypothetical protein